MGYFDVVVKIFLRGLKPCVYKWQLAAVEHEDQDVADAYEVIFAAWKVKLKRAGTGKHYVTTELFGFANRKMFSFFVDIPWGHTEVNQKHPKLFSFTLVYHDVIKLYIIQNVACFMNYLYSGDKAFNYI